MTTNSSIKKHAVVEAGLEWPVFHSEFDPVVYVWNAWVYELKTRPGNRRRLADMTKAEPSGNTSESDIDITATETSSSSQPSAAEDAVYCFSGRHFCSESTVRSGETFGNRTFINKGFKKWKGASALFQQHENTERHKISMKSRSSMQMSVASLLNSERISIKKTVCEEDPKLKERIIGRYGNYSSPEYQNDLISVYALRILRYITEKAKEAGFYSIMANETKVEQLAIFIRYVDCEDWKINERATGLHYLKDCSAENISNAIFSLLSEKRLDLKNCA
ncbi:hypothetical protein PR048_032302 [Dryococelus australis]|uniref:Uncharacterized protein n=1 Tax=Dryococelus australis TaxID=614101 RepID=A0ABQ9G5Y6_9NEOP|nr:hypothetical protein PR048_032302 [Dryococelus australis]